MNIVKILWDKVKKRLPILSAGILMMLVLAGCSAGATIDAALMLNKDLSGTRQINITISNNVFDQYFQRSIEELNVLIEENCPQGMTWNYSEDGEVKQYNMEIAFASPEEYRGKISSILGEEPEQLEIIVPDSVWANGIRVEESFSNRDLLEWLKNLLVDNGFVDASNADMIFADGTVTMVYNDQTYNTNNKINVNQVEYVTIDAIRIATSVNDLNHYDRKVMIQIPQASMDKKGEEIKAYLEGMVPAGASGEWSGSETMLFTVTENNLDASRLAYFNKALFGSQACTVTELDVSEYYSPFTFASSLSEHIDLSGFLADGSDGFMVTYEFLPGDFSVYSTADGTTPGSAGRKSEDGYMVLAENWCGGEPIDFSALIQKKYFVQKLTVKTDKRNNGDWERISSFTLESIPNTEEQNAIIEALKIRGETEITEDENFSQGAYTIVITQIGKPEDICENSKLLFDSAGTMLYARDREFWKINKQEAFTEEIFFGDLLDNVTKNFEIDYTAKIGRFANMQYCSADSAEMERGMLHMVCNDSLVDVVYVGNKVDVIAVLFWILIALGVLNLFFLLVKAGILKKKPKKAPVSETVQEQVSCFCEKCGTRREAGTKFCEKCGYKFEE